MRCKGILTRLLLCVISGFLLSGSFGCIARKAAPEQVEPAPPPPPPAFPPQSVMVNDDYDAFVDQNSKVLDSTQDYQQRATALFNLGFVYAYPKSPYYNAANALQCLNLLTKYYPESPLVYQAQVWIELLKKVQQGANGVKKRPKARSDVKSGSGDKGRAGKDAEAPEENVSDEEKQHMEEKLRSKEATIEELNKQIERYRQIDQEMEKKERELLN